MKTTIKAEIVAHSVNEQGDELISVLATFPRIILAEVNTHRMLSKNTSSSRAIPFKKMVETIQNDPFIPIAWQKEHKGMQGSEYFTDPIDLVAMGANWLLARDRAVSSAWWLNEGKLTKQLCNRLLEPFMWTTMLITGSKSGWENFFKLRCPIYDGFKSKKDFVKHNPEFVYALKPEHDIFWLKINTGQAEIHIMELAECIWDNLNESIPKQLKAGEWHVPFIDKFEAYSTQEDGSDFSINDIKVSVAMAARTSYTVVGEEKGIDYEAMIGLHDRLLAQDPPHSSPLEHCARAMSEDERNSFIKGDIHDFAERSLQKDIKEMTGKTFITGEATDEKLGWCNNLKGFIPYRYIIDNGLE